MILSALLLFFSIFLYFVAPEQYSQPYSWICALIFIVMMTSTIIKSCKETKTLLNFDVLFSMAFYYTNYVYPTILYPINPDFILFRLDFNHHYINQGIALSTIAYCSYAMGRLCYVNIKSEKNLIVLPKDRISVLRIVTIVMIFILVFYMLPNFGREYYGAANLFNNPFIDKVSQLVYVLAYFFIIYSFVKIKKQSLCSVENLLLIGGFVFLHLLFVSVGSRYLPIRLFLLFLFLFNTYYKKIANYQIALLVFGGMFFMTFLGDARSHQLDFVSDNVFVNAGRDLIINNRSLYVLMDYADNHGYTYGRTFLINILSIIPYAQSIFDNWFGLTEHDTNSAMLVTDLYFKGTKMSITGLGTNLVGDVYLAFGLIGDILLFYLLGLLVHILIRKILMSSNIFYVSSYAIFFFNSIYWTRSGFLTPIREIVWIFILIYLLKENKYIYANSIYISAQRIRRIIYGK